MSTRAQAIAEKAETWADENEIAPALLRTMNGKPALELPGIGRPMGDFARDVGTMLAGKNIFARKGCAFTLDAEGQRLEPATATWLRSWAEKHVTPYKVRVSQERTIELASTMSEDAAPSLNSWP